MPHLAENSTKSCYAATNYHDRVADAEGLQDYLSLFIATDPRNQLPERGHVPIFEAPVVGVAAADDPLFNGLSDPKVVGPIHVTPDYWLPGAKTVISFFAPFSSEIKASYLNIGSLPSLEWVSARLNGEVFINVMRRAILRLIEKQGGRAVIPNLDLRYDSQDFKAKWSERHVAFIAGVGTFGLHCGILTTKGAAGRIGSVVTDVIFPITQRPYTNVYEYCLFKSAEKCGACIKKCPANALSPAGKDHQLCDANGSQNIRKAYIAWGYHSCGHCQNNLPCSNGLPAGSGASPGSI